MFKRNLLKRTLPIMLSVAMTFQSVPITAMAAENPPAIVQAEAEDSGTATDVSEEVSVESAAEPAAEAPSDSEQESDQGTENVTDGESGEESAPEEGTAVVSGSETNDQENSGSETEAETSTEIKSETEERAEANQTETADAAGAEKAAEEVKSTEIKINLNGLSGFDLQREASELTYTTVYSTSDKFGSVVASVKNAARIYVNDEDKMSASSYLDTEWQKMDANGAWASMSGRPDAVGSYRLKLTLAAQEEGLWLACEKYVYFNITARELKLRLNGVNDEVTAGSRIKDFTVSVQDEAELENADGQTFEKDVNYRLEAAVYKNGEDEVTEDVYFSKDVDYHFTVKVEWINTSMEDNSMEHNYKVDCEGREYPIHFEGIQATKVDVTRKNPGTEIVKTYGKDNKSAWSIEEIEQEYVDTTKTQVLVVVDEDEKGAKQDKDGDWVVPLEKMAADDADDTIKATPSWYTKESNYDENTYEYIFGEDDIDKDTQFFFGEDLKYLYTSLPGTTINEVGEYYLVYKYPGTEGAFAEGYSEPIKVTIDPREVILKPDEEIVTKLKLQFNTSMTKEDVKRELAKVEAAFFDADANTTKVNVPVTEDFYGVSYDNHDATQYYKPVFGLMYTETPTNASGDAEPQKEGPLTPVGDADYDSDGYLKVKTSDKAKYTYYIAFTGYKAVYGVDGDVEKQIPVTEATDAANRNYRILADEYTLGDVTNAVRVDAISAVKTVVNVDAIIKAFTDQHAEGNTGNSIGKVLNTPARMVYDPESGLFAEKKTYKAAQVTEVNEDNSAGTAVSTSDKDLTYEWEYGSLTGYETLIHDARADAQNENHEAWEAALENFTFSSYGTEIPQDAGIYRLHVAYKDNSLAPTHAPSDGYVYFLIEKQQLVFKAENQYAEYGDDVRNFTRRGYSLYKIPGNNESQLKVETDTPLEWDADGDADWYAVNKAKDENGQDKNPAEWELSIDTFRNDKPYDYRAAIWFDSDPSGTIYKKDADVPYGKDSTGKDLNWKNYTTRYWDATANGGKGDYNQRFIVEPDYAKILFGKTEVVVSIDNNPFEDKVYDGDPIAAALTGVTLKDKAGTPVSDMQLSESLDAEGAVKVGWYWEEGGKVVPTSEAKYGGTYWLVASFEGNDTYKAIGDYEESWMPVKDKYGEECTFDITPLEVEITPDLKEKATAGEPLSSMLGDGNVVATPVYASHPIPAADEWLFKQGAGWVESVVKGTPSRNVTTGYPILTNGSFGKATYYENNKEISDVSTHLIRSGKEYEYDVKLSGSTLFAQYAYSYQLTFKTARLAEVVRGDAKVGATNFFVEGDGERKGRVSVYTEKTDETSYEIKPQEGIPFVYKELGDNNTSLMRYDSENWTWISYYNYWQSIDSELKKQLSLDKNYIAVNILSPREFSSELYKNGNETTFAKDNFVYENSIKNAGGYVIAGGLVRDPRESGYYSDYRYAITALFPVECDADGKIVDAQKTFKITWEKGYIETFTLNLENAKLEANLKKAVAPKSLAFNGVVTKMAIGEEQQLDVKITKAQLGDVIQIRYRLEDNTADIVAENNITHNDYASIDPETGRITALDTEDGKKTTPVTVEAYPVRLSADGKGYEEITGKGVKIAKTKISITEVTAPVIKKVISKDISAEVQYTKTGDGYRREIYVMPAADKKAANQLKEKDFLDAIESMKNGQWKGTFATAPIYKYRNNDYDADLKLCKAFIPGSSDSLEIGSAYAVYVRNVSAVRTLADGSKVTESVAGSVKVFETTKSRVGDLLQPYFEVTEEKTKTNPVRYYNEKDEEDGYIVDLADKSAQLLVKGRFYEKPSNPAADEEDTIDLKLPLKKNDDYAAKLKNVYLEPKLSYYITDDDDSPEFDKKGKLLNPSKYATINNSGKITLKGVGRNGGESVTLWVFADKEKNEYWSDAWNCCNLIISAKPDSVTPKKVKAMKVGDGIRLADYLEYKQGKTKVPNYWSSNIVIQNKDEVEEQGFKIYKLQYGEDWYAPVGGPAKAGEYVIIAESPGVKDCTLKFTDALWNTDEEGKVTRFTSEVQELKLSTSALDQVKSLKTVYTDDKHITLNFAHAGNPEAFDIEVTDARGSVIFKKLISNNPDIVRINDVADDTWLWNEQKGIVGTVDGYDGGQLKYFEKTKTFAYTIYTEKLMRLSSYTISVDAVYNGVSAAGTKKPASTKAKTTNIPASYGNADTSSPASDYFSPYDDDEKRGFKLVSGHLDTYLTSGNTYTVELDVQNDLARTRGTDTLTWKSSNTKVLSIKANQGSYTATVKAMQQGKATITVTSKVTKKTIARYHVAVKAVGNGSSYGGDFEWGDNGNTTPFYDTFIKTYDPYYEGRVEVLTVSNPVTVEWEDFPSYDSINDFTSNDYTWVQFTAPAYGEYTFFGNMSYKYCYGDKSKRQKDSDWLYSDVENRKGYMVKNLRLEEGQKIYFKVFGAFTLKVDSYTDFTKLTTNYTKERPFVTEKDAWVSFTAPEDNYYTFNSSKEFKYEKNGGSTQNAEGSDDGYVAELGLKVGDTIFIKVAENSTLYVTKREYDGGTVVGNGSIDLTFTKNDEQQYKYAKVTADLTGDYTFTYQVQDGVKVELLEVDGSDDSPYDGNGDEAILSAIYAEPYADTVTTSESVTLKLFIEKGKTVVIKITVTPDAFGKTESVPVKIDVAKAGVDPLTNGAEVAAKTSKTFEYTIPGDTKETKYTIAAQDADISWCKAVGGEEFNAIGRITFTVKDGKIIESNPNSLKAGEKIYVKVDASGLSEKAVVSITAKAANEPFDMTKPSVSVKLPDDDGEQYTFVARKTGYYEFTAAVSGEQPKHNLTATCVDEGIRLDSTNPGTSKRVVKLNPGNYTFVIGVEANGGSSEDKTDATLSVKEIEANALNVGDNKITLGKGEVKYYFLKADVKGSYTIKWSKDAGADNGEADVEYQPDFSYYYDDMVDGSYFTMSSSMNDSNIRYIRVTQTGDKTVSGNLQVVGATKNSVLTSGKEETVNFTNEESSKTFTFTIPAKSDLGYTVIVENASTVPEGKTVPMIRVNINNNVNIPGWRTGKRSQDMIYWTDPYETKTITITASGIEDGVIAAAKILVKPITAEVSTGQISTRIVEADSKWYSISIPDDGRYLLSTDEGQGSDYDVEWYTKTSDGIDGYEFENAKYVKKGKELYVNVKARNGMKAEGVDVTLTLAKIPQPETLTLGENGKVKVELTDATPEYYAFTAPVTANYFVSGHLDVQPLVPSNSDDDWYSGWELKEGESILIIVGHSGTLTVEKSNMLTTAAPTSVTLAAGESASFVFKPYAMGYYDFTVSEAEKLSVGAGNGSYSNIYTGDIKGYRVIKVSERPDASDQYAFPVTNTDANPVTFTVTTKVVTPVEMKLDTDFSLEKGRLNLFEFAVPETCRYTFTCSEGSKVTDENGDDISEILQKSTGDEKMLIYAEYTGAESAGTVKVSKLAPIAITAEETAVSLKKGEVKWFVYTAEKTCEYTFTVPYGMQMEGYKSLSDPNASVRGDSLTFGLEAGSAVYFKVEIKSSAEGEKTGMFTVKVGEELQKLSVGTPVEVDSGKYVVFTPSEDGFYKFENTLSEDQDHIYYHGDSALNAGYGCHISFPEDSDKYYYVAKNDVVFLRATDKVKFEVTEKKGVISDPEAMPAAGIKDHTIEGYMTKRWYTYTAEKSGKYSFMLQNSPSRWSPYMHLYRSGERKGEVIFLGEEIVTNEYDTLTNGEYGIRDLELKEGEKVYIRMVCSNAISTTTYSVSVEKK